MQDVYYITAAVVLVADFLYSVYRDKKSDK
jgi:hypothetical protein